MKPQLEARFELHGFGLRNVCARVEKMEPSKTNKKKRSVHGIRNNELLTGLAR